MPTGERAVAAKALYRGYHIAQAHEAEYDPLWDPTSAELLESLNTLPPLSETFAHILRHLYSQRYLQPCTRISKSTSHLDLTLNVWRHEHPKIFRQLVCLWPATFDALHLAIKDDPVFQNSSHQPQFPVEQQMVVALYRLGHYGNSASIQEVALWAGWGYGTVDSATRRFLVAVCRPQFLRAAVMWPTEQEQEDARIWVEEQTCSAWRGGWLMVDGTLVPLHCRPGHFGNIWYDRKNNYSLNVQIICLPNLRIVDFGVGLPGSQHDSRAWNYTRLPVEHNTLLKAGEWVWGDSAYPLRSWLVAPYKKPASELRENRRFNYYVSKVRVRSEHCNALLKGRFGSLRGLRLKLNDESHIKFATAWVTACIAVHSFAMQTEMDLDYQADVHFARGLRIIERERERAEELELARARLFETGREAQQIRDQELEGGKAKREEIKKALFEAIGQ